MPKINADLVAAYTKRKREQAGGETSSTQPQNAGPRISEDIPPPRADEVEDPTPISVIHPEDLQPRKRARGNPGSSSIPPGPDSGNIFAGIETFDVSDPGTALIAGNTAVVLVRSLQRFATSVGSRAVDEKETLRSEIVSLKKINSELKRAAKEAAAAQKKAEEGLEESNKEVARLKGEVAKLEESVKAVGEQKDELEIKAAEDLNKAEKRIQELGVELEEMTGECIGAYEEGYNQCVGHIKFLHPDLDTSELSCTKKVENGKLVDAAQ